MAAYFLSHCHLHLHVMVAKDLEQEETQIQWSIVYVLHVVHELQVCEVCYLQMYDYLTWEFGVLEEIIIERCRFTLDIMTHLD